VKEKDKFVAEMKDCAEKFNEIMMENEKYNADVKKQLIISSVRHLVNY